MQRSKKTLTHRKGEDIGRTVDTTIVRVESVHPGIVNDEQAHVTTLTFEGREQLQERLSERPGVDRDDLLLIPATDGHSCLASGASSLLTRPWGIQHDDGGWRVLCA